MKGCIRKAKKQGEIPAEWLIILLRFKDIHPEWVLTGNNPWRLMTPSQPGEYETGETAQERQADKKALKRLWSRTLAEELVRRSICDRHAR